MVMSSLIKSAKKLKKHMDKVKSRPRGPAGGPAPKKKKMKAGGSATKGTHVTKEGKTAKKGLWYNIHQKRKRGETMRKKGAKGAPTAAAIRKSQGK